MSLRVQSLNIYYPMQKQHMFAKETYMHAVKDLSFSVETGQTLGIVGESGCGKSSVARALLGLQPHLTGEIWWHQHALHDCSDQQWMPLRRDIQMIFQDPLASLDPRFTIEQCIQEPLNALYPELTQIQKQHRVEKMMQRVGLSPELKHRYPHEFSGGQCQRVGIARALIVEPKLLICDEPVSALDVLIQAQIIQLLKELQQALNLTMIFISHDLNVIGQISNQIMVMYLGRLMEWADKTTLQTQAKHPYTQALWNAIPNPFQPQRKTCTLLYGEIPSILTPPSGCVFHTRCPYVMPQCKISPPSYVSLSSTQKTACYLITQDK